MEIFHLFDHVHCRCGGQVVTESRHLDQAGASNGSRGSLRGRERDQWIEPAVHEHRWRVDLTEISQPVGSGEDGGGLPHRSRRPVRTTQLRFCAAPCERIIETVSTSGEYSAQLYRGIDPFFEVGAGRSQEGVDHLRFGQ